MTANQTIMVTGGEGFTGSHAVEYFKSAGYSVVSITRHPLNNHSIKCDLTSAEETLNVIKEVRPNIILHLAGNNNVNESWNDPLNCIEANVMTTLNILDAVRKVQPDTKVFIVGSILQYNQTTGKQVHPYGLSKTLQIEASQSWAKLFNLNVYFAIPTNLVGPGPSKGVCSIFADKIVYSLKQNQQPILNVNNLFAAFDFLDVRDAIKAYHMIITNGKQGKLYNIATGDAHTLEDIISIYESIIQQPMKINSKEQSKTTPLSLDVSDIYKLGWKPTISLHDSLHDTLSYYQRLWRNL